MPAAPPVVAHADPRLTACVVACRPLIYASGADTALDRPAHVRAASSIVRLGGVLAAIQDDANFIALIDPATWAVEPLSLPAGYGGKRQFDDTRGTKRFKLDLEACVVTPGPEGPRLVAFGSGSTPARERVIVVEGLPGDAPAIRVVDATVLYEHLRAATDFSGSELNIEGAAVVGPALRLFQRGNGAPSGGLSPVDATCDLDLAALLAFLDEPVRFQPPPPTRIVRYSLGAVAGCRLTFTDAAPCPAGLLYSAAAEDSPDAVRDGPVAGSAIGLIGDDGPPRYAVITTASRALFDGKVEGLALDPADPARLFLVVDRDDAATPSELCEVALGGPWFMG
ncbi:MAG: hypothetical protein HGA45_36795 [Chloroflexales bacterium]|nr:hypothetical protein [Chloroflexales bacterium]